MINAEMDLWHRVQRGRKTLATVLGLAVFTAAIIPTNVRAVFLHDSRQVPAKAFAARLRPAEASRNDFVLPSDFIPSSTAQGSSPAARLLPAAMSDSFVNRAPPSTSPIDEAIAGSANEQGETPLGSELPAQAVVNRPLFAQNAVPFSPGLAGSPPSGSITPTEPALPTDPVAAVPEPGSWAMLLLGFFAIGGMLRRDGGPAGRSRKTPGVFNQYAFHHPIE